MTVLPTHRRQGILTRLAAAEHDALVERGEALALLYAAEFAIYGRYGYGPATRFATWTVDFMRSRTSPRDADTGSMELVTPTQATADELRGFYDEWRLSRPGEIKRRSWSWAARLGILPEAWGPPFKGSTRSTGTQAGGSTGSFATGTRTSGRTTSRGTPSKLRTCSARPMRSRRTCGRSSRRWTS